MPSPSLLFPVVLALAIAGAVDVRAAEGPIAADVSDESERAEPSESAEASESPGLAERATDGSSQRVSGGLVPPSPVELQQAVYPEAALATREEAQVELLLTLDSNGGVTDAEVTASAGESFDAAAVAAALRNRFTPAIQDGTPVASRIAFTYFFAPPPLEPANGSESPPTEGTENVVVEAPPSARSLPGLQAVVRGATDARALKESAQAVKVIETVEAGRQSADMGEVLARSEGVGVRRGGGLGSGTRFSLNGFSDDQIRFLLDGIPLELAGYPFGIGNIPVNLVERVEIYRGVVPVRFGADALGGAVNLVSHDGSRGKKVGASYQVGSFGTHRLTVEGRHRFVESGLVLRASGFLDRAENDYPITVEVPDSRGKLTTQTVRRFHDAYAAQGAQLEAGFVDHPWAKRLVFRGFFTDSAKELQHNQVMTVPYGEATYDRMTAGGNLRYEHRIAPSFDVDLSAGYAFSQTDFVDMAECVYSWLGECVFERSRPGEISGFPRDQIQLQHGTFARLNGAWTAAPGHVLRLTVAPTLTWRTGEDRTPRPAGSRDPTSADQRLLTLVSGVEHEWKAFAERLENVAFVKSYAQVADSTERLPSGDDLVHARDTHRFGLGDALRFRLIDGLLAKLSYEWATRLPRPDEAFGDGVLIAPNPTLEPETSHNLNVGFTGELRDTPVGRFEAEVNGFLRQADQLIVLLGTDNAFSWQNVYAARAVGVEASGRWTSPKDILRIDANGTWLDLRNASEDGPFRRFTGDRIPNRPWLFANLGARLRFTGLLVKEDELTFGWHLRFVESFHRGWESVGRASTKQVVPAQLLQSLMLTWRLTVPFDLALTAEVQNLTDTPSFDYFGAQRPGRAAYVKLATSL